MCCDALVIQNVIRQRESLELCVMMNWNLVPWYHLFILLIAIHGLYQSLGYINFVLVFLLRSPFDVNQIFDQMSDSDIIVNQWEERDYHNGDKFKTAPNT